MTRTQRNLLIALPVLLAILTGLYLATRPAMQPNESATTDSFELVSDETVKEEWVEFQVRSRFVMEESLICKPDTHTSSLALMEKNMEYARQLDMETLGELVGSGATSLEKVQHLRQLNKVLAEWEDYLAEIGCFR